MTLLLKTRSHPLLPIRTKRPDKTVPKLKNFCCYCEGTFIPRQKSNLLMTLVSTAILGFGTHDHVLVHSFMSFQMEHPL
jgi:hypothetical protein